MMEGSGERATGTPNTIYDLSSVLFHALEGGASYDQYIQDAEEAGDRDLADFFRQVRDEDSARADEARTLLAERTPSATVGMEGATSDAAVSGEGVAVGVPPRTEPAGGMPGTEPLAEELPPSRAEERPLGPEEIPPPMTEDRPLGTEGTMPPRTEGVPPPRSEEVLPRTEEAPLSEERERTRQTEGDQGEDRGLIDRVRDALSGEEEERGRREGPDEPRRR